MEAGDAPPIMTQKRAKGAQNKRATPYSAAAEADSDLVGRGEAPNVPAPGFDAHKARIAGGVTPGRRRLADSCRRT